jgi:hypothetical protein
VTKGRAQLFRCIYVLYGILVVAMTVFLFYGRPPITDKSITVAETFFLLPGIILYVPLLLLSGGIHWSLLPLGARMPLWGTLNVLGYLAIPLAIRGMIKWWRELKTSGKQGNIWQDILRRPTTMVVFGVGMLLLALNGAIQVRLGIAGPTDIANMVFGTFGAIGLWYLAYYQRRYGTIIPTTGPPAWTRWAVPLAALTGAVIGGGLAYREAMILRWSTASATLLAVSVTVVTSVMVWIVFRMVRKER